MTQDREAIRERYAAAAGTAIDPMMKHGGTCGATFYDASHLEGLPVSMLDSSLGCANPVALVDLREGETVLDLGSGTGVDVLLSAARVGPSGKAYGLDMTDEMLERARENQRKTTLQNVEFLKGHIERVPLPAGVVDVIISNCVINLSLDKHAVFAEMFRVLRPSGRVAIADLIADEDMDPVIRERITGDSPCLAGSLTRHAYQSGLDRRGFRDISITNSHEAAPGFTSAIVRATKP